MGGGGGRSVGDGFMQGLSFVFSKLQFISQNNNNNKQTKQKTARKGSQLILKERAVLSVLRVCKFQQF